MVCGFDFKRYGACGKNFIEVHHVKPLYDLEKEEIIDPKTDLVCLCSNCHRIIHRKRDFIFNYRTAEANFYPFLLLFCYSLQKYISVRC